MKKLLQCLMECDDLSRMLNGPVFLKMVPAQWLPFPSTLIVMEQKLLVAHCTLLVDNITETACFYSSGNGLLMKSLVGVHLSTETIIPNVHMRCCVSTMPFQSTHAQMDGK